MNMQRAAYLATECPRLRYLLRIFDVEGLFAEASTTRPRFIVVCHWPIVAWLVEMFLRALGLRYVTIAAGSSMNDRTEAATNFNDPRSDCTVLLTTYNLGGLGLNLHTECSRVVLMEPSLNFNAEFQAIGRVHRLGQREPQKVWHLFQDHTISRWIMWNSQRKILPQIAAQSQQVITPALEAVLARLDPREAESQNSDESEDNARSVTINKLAKNLLRDTLGMGEGCADPESFKDVQDVGTETDGRGHHVSKRVPVNSMTRKMKRKADDHPEDPTPKKQQLDR